MTKKTLFIPIVAALGLAFSAMPAAAEDDVGRLEYLNACASCHGMDGTGGGDVAKFLTVEVPNLTKLAETNDGVFPLLEVIYIIDGRAGVRGHGTEIPVWGAGLRLTDKAERSEEAPMPVWGDFFRERLGEFAGPYGTETIVRGRILNLALYLESIQE